MKFGGKLWARRAPAIVCGAVLCTTAIAGCGGDGDPEAAEPAKPVTTDEPVSTFAPVAHLHERERLFPITANTFLEHSNLTWGESSGIDVTIVAGRGREGYDVERVPKLEPDRMGYGDPYSHKARPQGETYTTTQHTRPFDPGRPPELKPEDGFYLDLLTKWLPGLRSLHRDGSQVVLDGAQTYYAVDDERIDGRPGTRITYWLLFGSHRPPADNATVPDSHEGDWERVSVLLRNTSRPDRFIPVSVRYHEKQGMRDVPWSSARLAGGGPGPKGPNHPVVLVAAGSHTPYPEPVSRRRTVSVPSGVETVSVTVTEEAKECDECPLWRTWEDLRDARDQPWYGYGGAWGYVFTREEASGPIGPSRFTSR